VFCGDLHNGIHIGGAAGEVDRHDGFGARRDGRLDETGIDIVGIPVDIDKDGHGAGFDRGAGCGNEGVGGDDHLVAGVDVSGGEGDAQSCGAAVHGDTVPGRMRFGELPFKTFTLLAGQPSPFTALDDPGQSLNLIIPPDRPDRKRQRPHRGTTIDRQRHSAPPLENQVLMVQISRKESNLHFARQQTVQLPPQGLRSGKVQGMHTRPAGSLNILFPVIDEKRLSG